MIWNDVVRSIARILNIGLTWCSQVYLMITGNTLILAFVLMFAVFVGLALLKRLININ